MSVSFASSLSAQVKIILHVATGRHPEMDGNSRKNIRDILCRWLHFFQTNIELDFAHCIAPVRHLRLSVLHRHPPLTLVCCTNPLLVTSATHKNSSPLHFTQQHEKFCLQPIHSFQFQKPIVRSGTPTISSKFNQTFAPQHQKIWHSSRR